MRRAYSLVEMTVVMTVGAMLLGIAVTLLGSLLQAERSSSAQIERNATLSRLADRFRRDVHVARRRPVAEQNKAGESIWRFDLDGGCSVRYVFGTRRVPDSAGGQDEVVREERAGKTVVRQESYRLPEDHMAEITIDGPPESPVVHLIVAPTDASSRAGHEIRIDALAGRDCRYAKTNKGRKPQ
jgi:prepilin-type N-terminal cleavage/methylation domain-containing protein